MATAWTRRGSKGSVLMKQGCINIARFRVLLLFLAVLHPACCQARPSARVLPPEVSLPSAEASGITVNDTIWLTYYPASQPTEQPAPAVVLLHALGETRVRLTG